MFFVIVIFMLSKSEKTRSNDDDKLSKIYHYYKTDHFTQTQLAYIFNNNFSYYKSKRKQKIN